MQTQIWAGAAAELRCGHSKVVCWQEREIAVFNLEGTYFALDNLCPHKEAPLHEGRLVHEQGQTWVSCPWHRFLFDPRTGRCDRQGFDTRAYAVTLEEGQLYIQLC